MTEETNITDEIAKIQEDNQRLVQALVDADYVFDADELLMSRINLLSGIMIELGIVTEQDLNIRWELIVNGILNNAIADIERRSEIVHKETTHE